MFRNVLLNLGIDATKSLDRPRTREHSDWPLRADSVLEMPSNSRPHVHVIIASHAQRAMLSRTDRTYRQQCTCIVERSRRYDLNDITYMISIAGAHTYFAVDIALNKMHTDFGILSRDGLDQRMQHGGQLQQLGLICNPGSSIFLISASHLSLAGFFPEFLGKCMALR